MSSLSKAAGTLQKHTIAVFRNPHFWIIFFMTAALIVMYYLSYATIREKVGWLQEYRNLEYTHNIHGSLLYIPYLYATIVFGWIGITTIWVLSFSIMLPRIFYYLHNVSSFSNNVIFMTVPVMVILLVLIISNWLKSNRRMFIERETQRQAFMSQVLKAQEDERKYISQELHDDTIQTLLALTHQIQSSLNKEKSSYSPKIAHQLDSYSKSIYTVTEDLRRLCFHLRPSILDDIGLLEAIRALVDSFVSDTMKVRLVVNVENRHFSSETDVIVYRLIQEALNNANRHSEATEVVVTLDFSHKTTRVVIQDNGKGFMVPKQLSEFSKSNKLGVMGMQERATLLGGTFSIRSQVGAGTSVYLEF